MGEVGSFATDNLGWDTGTMTRNRGSVEALIFDAYGTLFDTHSFVAALEFDLPGHGEFVTHVWRLKQLEYSWLRTAADDYPDFRYSLARIVQSVDFPGRVPRRSAPQRGWS